MSRTGFFTPRLPLPVARSERPAFHPDCCLSLSTNTTHQILDALPSRDALVLSVGSGSGLLEALLSVAEPKLWLEVVEVQGVNKYMPEDMLHVVKGTWQLCERAKTCDVLLFVYPREPSLVKKYIDMLDFSSKVRTIIWIGPSRDWQEFKQCFGDSRFTTMETPLEISSCELLTVSVRVPSCEISPAGVNESLETSEEADNSEICETSGTDSFHYKDSNTNSSDAVQLTQEHIPSDSQAILESVPGPESWAAEQRYQKSEPQPVSSLPPRLPPPSRWFCPSCNTSFAKKKRLSSHYGRAHRDNARFECCYCRVPFGAFAYLAKHWQYDLVCREAWRNLRRMGRPYVQPGVNQMALGHRYNVLRQPHLPGRMSNSSSLPQ